MKRIFYTTLIAILAMGSKVMAQYCPPNGDFESWNSTANYGPDSGWYNSNVQSLAVYDTLTVWSVTGFSGQAVHLQTAIIGIDTLEAWITNSKGDPSRGQGGFPYSQQPTSLSGYYRYNLPGNDSATIVVMFKKSGSVVSMNKLMIRNSTGSLSTFTPFTMPVTLSVIPDSVIIAAASSNVFGSGIQSGSWLEVDQLAFGGTGITQVIPDGNFDTWINSPFMTPSGWAIGADFAFTGVTQSTDAHTGTYSVQLVTLPSYGGSDPFSPGEITNGIMHQHNGPSGGSPYTLTSDSLFGYYKYAPSGIDTASIWVNLTHLGTNVGGCSINLPAASSWTLFGLPISAGTAPDTMMIDIQSSKQPFTTSSSGSTLKIDHLWLKSQPLDLNEIRDNGNLSIYPNPANDILNFKFEIPVNGNIEIKIFDMMGRIIETHSVTGAPYLISLEVGQLPAGIYYYNINQNDNSLRGKFLKY